LDRAPGKSAFDPEGPRVSTQYSVGFAVMYYEILGTNIRLAGSLHLLPASTPQMAPWVWDAYQWSEVLVFEAEWATIHQHIRLTGNASLEHKLPPQVWTALTAVWPTELDVVSSLKPWFALMKLSLSRIVTVPGVEAQLSARAKEESKPIGYLESTAEFAALADSVPDTV